MKKTTLFLSLALIAIFAIAQPKTGIAPLDKGGLQLNFGTGFSNHGLPLYASLDIALHKDITLTPQINTKFEPGEVHFGSLVKCDYHWNYLIGIPSNWDFYAGMRAGFDIGHDFYPEFGIQVGGRWYFAPKWGLNLEFAGGTGYETTFGMSYKLK